MYCTPRGFQCEKIFFIHRFYIIKKIINIKSTLFSEQEKLLNNNFFFGLL